MGYSVADIFAEMPDRFRPAGAVGYRASIEFRFSRGAVWEAWHLRIGDGACEAGPGALDDPDAVVKMPAELWCRVFDEGVSEGSPAAMEAFTQGIIVLEGNIDVLLRLQDPNMFRRD